MALFYVMAFIPIVIGAALWVIKRKIVWWEWAISAGLSLVTAGIMHITAVYGMTADTETWSGNIVSSKYVPKWVEEYEEAIYKNVTKTRTVGFGKNRRTETYIDRVFSHYETRYRTHTKYWQVRIGFGAKIESKRIPHSFFEEIKSKWGGESCMKAIRGNRPGFYSGNKNDYILSNKTGYIYPAVTEVYFENRVKAAPTTFSYPNVPENTKVFDYPDNSNWRHSQRLIGIAGGPIKALEWDRLNSRLGSRKKVNLVLIGFGAADSGIAQLQEAKWIGGKKNDLVLCYGGEHTKPTWTYVFGWTEKEIIKRNLETILLNGPVDETILPKIEEEVIKNYTIKDWKKFDYISIEPPLWSYLVMLGVLAVTQGGFLLWGVYNSYTKDGNEKNSFSYNRY